jgi:hypothetical protein
VDPTTCNLFRIAIPRQSKLNFNETQIGAKIFTLVFLKDDFKEVYFKKDVSLVVRFNICSGFLQDPHHGKVNELNIMTTHFITAEIDLSATKSSLVDEVNAELVKHGEPLRWAITSVDDEKQTAQLEAVVTRQALAE